VVQEKSLKKRLQREFSEESVEGALAVFRVISVFFAVSIFWALFDQHSSSWIRQATMMDRNVSLPLFGSFELLPSQIPAINPLLVMLLIPLLSIFLVRLSQAGIKVSPLKKMTVGMFIAGTSFVAVALIQRRIDDLSQSGQAVHVFWQTIPYVLITLSEVLVSVTGLEFAYSQAPPRMKSTIMGFWLLTVAFGNVLVALLARFGDLELEDFFWVFALLMGVAAVIFGVRAAFFKARDYPQG